MSIAVEREQELLEAVGTIAREVAAVNASAVDRDSRFPIETVDALREYGALSSVIPTELGGDGVSFETVAQCCLELGRHCGASAMVFAMHQIQLLSIIRHYEPGSWFEQYLRDQASEQRLIASVTSEVGNGGDMGRSIAAVIDVDADTVRFEKQAPTVSYGAYADDLLTTLRRSETAEPGDQVMVLSSQEQTDLEPTGTWDVLGMRGTCSPGCVVRATFPRRQVMAATPFSRVASESMVPISHILWSHLWLGIAEDAFDRARSFVRASAKRRPGEPIPAAQRLSHVMSELSMLRAEVESARNGFVVASAQPGREELSTMAAALRFNNLKIAASEHAADICRGALDVCGIVGFKNDTPFSVGRHLRDTMSAALMIANDRIHNTNASLLLIAKEI
ncbi:MAG: acyl-CoA dehydrogenase family protein [Solirubrobacteraceae bacterium]